MQLHTSKLVAEYLDVTERRVRQLRDEGVITEVRPGMYYLKDTTRKYIRSLKKGDSVGLNYTEEKAKLTKAKREREELELREREKFLHESVDVERVVSRILVNFKSRLLGIPATLSPTLAKKTDKTEINQLILEAIKEALVELSDYNNLFREKGSEESGEDS